MTATLSCSFHRTAGFRAGSIPMIGMEGYCCLSVEAATLVAVLQAMTIAFTSFARRKLVHCSDLSRIASLVFVP